MSKKTILAVENLGFTLEKKRILADVSLTVGEGEFVGIIGPNGSGKSTLLKNICKVHRPSQGNIRLKGRRLEELSNRQMARELAVVAQEHQGYFDFTVAEVVAMGRYPAKGMLENLGEKDWKIVENTLAQVAMAEFGHQSFLQLSGGEKQRVLIARALAQETELILLDEPTNHLDIKGVIDLLQLLKATGKTILAALHDLPIAINYCQRIYVMAGGHIVAQGPPEKVISPELIRQVYQVDAQVFSRQDKLFVDYA